MRSLTRNPASFSPFGDRVERHPLDFEDSEQLVKSLEGADTLYNTFWIRFSRGPVNHDLAVRNTRNLVDAAVSAGSAPHRAHQHYRRLRRVPPALLPRKGTGRGLHPQFESRLFHSSPDRHLWN